MRSLPDGAIPFCAWHFGGGQNKQSNSNGDRVWYLAASVADIYLRNKDSTRTSGGASASSTLRAKITESHLDWLGLPSFTGGVIFTTDAIGT